MCGLRLESFRLLYQTDDAAAVGASDSDALFPPTLFFSQLQLVTTAVLARRSAPAALPGRSAAQAAGRALNAAAGLTPLAFARRRA